MEGNSSLRHLNCSNVSTIHAASHGPVFITDRGHPAYVLLTVEEYQRLTKGQASIGELLAMPNADAVEFDPPRMADDILKPADFS